MSWYQLLDNLHVKINKGEGETYNFWNEEIYDELEFAEACLDVHLLIQKELCRKIDNKELKKLEQEPLKDG